MPIPTKDAVRQKKISDATDFLPLFWVLLSYRTPMRIRELLIFGHGSKQTGYFRCPRCGSTVEREYMSFCDRCGQSLNWRGCWKVPRTYITPK